MDGIEFLFWEELVEIEIVYLMMKEIKDVLWSFMIVLISFECVVKLVFGVFIIILIFNRICNKLILVVICISFCWKS